jgi:hypothetical protein
MADFKQYGVPQKYIGASTDAKPTGVQIGSTCYETDTKKLFITADGTNWTEIGSVTATIEG